ncbi:MAG TPA: YHS domain-containing (seleno)protein [Actinomycetota bacterium]|nr:YHS domain-containing (seleno)protein [Actinomycetota bacterium]
MHFRRLAVLTLVLTAPIALPAQQGPTPAAAPSKTLVNVDRHGVALAGYDPVAFFTDSAAVRGDSTHRATWGGATYWFASDAHRVLFLAEPTKYVPQFGGYCAYGASRGYAAKVEIDTWQVIDGRLTLNYDRGVQQTFNQDVAGYLQKANANWPGIVAREGH